MEASYVIATCWLFVANNIAIVKLFTESAFVSLIVVQPIVSLSNINMVFFLFLYSLLFHLVECPIQINEENRKLVRLVFGSFKQI
jgi:hypothetical protein